MARFVEQDQRMVDTTSRRIEDSRALIGDCERLLALVAGCRALARDFPRLSGGRLNPNPVMPHRLRG
jgi:hypothetical protein